MIMIQTIVQVDEIANIGLSLILSVLWKISPLLAEWISAPQNLLRTEGVLTPSSAVVELGCGISGLIALCLAPSVGTYVATDQDYVSRWFRSNVEANATAALRLSEDLHRFQENDHQSSRNRRHREKRGSKLKVSVGKKTSRNEKGGDEDSHEKIGGGLGLDNIFFTPLDWELDDPSTLSVSTTEPDRTGFDVLISCDCIYNEALIPPFVRTCVDICRMRPAYQSTQDSLDGGEHRPTVCVIAQQQRSPEVFESWLRETLRFFRVWRVIDDALPEALRSGSGYLIHLLVLREEST